MQGVTAVLQYLVLAALVLWVVVFLLIWQKKKRFPGLHASRVNRDSSRSLLKPASPKPQRQSKPAPVIELFPASTSPKKAHPKEDHSE